MGWAVGYDPNWKRDVGYGVPSKCDHPDCDEEIDRGLGYVCGNDVYGGGENCCGLYFCENHLGFNVDDHGHLDGPQRCDRCLDGEDPFTPKPDVAEWINWKLTDESWAPWRAEYPEEVAAMTTGEPMSADTLTTITKTTELQGDNA